MGGCWPRPRPPPRRRCCSYCYYDHCSTRYCPHCPICTRPRRTRPPPKINIIASVHDALFEFFQNNSSTSITSCIFIYDMDLPDGFCDTCKIARLVLLDSDDFIVPNSDKTMLTISKSSPQNLVLHVLTMGENTVYVYQTVDDIDSLTSPFLPNSSTNGDLPCKTELITNDETKMKESVNMR